jgi:hypothetical protein
MVQVFWQDFDKAMALVGQFCHRLVMFADPKPYTFSFRITSLGLDTSARSHLRFYYKLFHGFV